MSPQFVDWNADGHLDIVAGTFSGSPYVALGNGKGWHQPEMILDKDGERIVLNQFWNYETKKWDSTKRCDPAGGAPAKGHATSAWAMDWEGDGDLDLLLGDYDGGYLYLRKNDGTATKPAFGKQNVLVESDGKPIHVGKVATMRLVDWNGDGTQDLLLGTMGDTYGTGVGGGVFGFANSASNLPPVFGPPKTWIEPSKKGANTPIRPDAGLYMDVADLDGDGDLDVLVGGYSIWTPPARQLTDAQREQVGRLEAELKAATDQVTSLSTKIHESGDGLPEPAKDAAVAAARAKHDLELKALSKKRSQLSDELEPLTPGPKRRSFVWLYENLAKGKAGSSTRVHK